ncbi:hypothetical protein WT67_21300 [Burkholderia stagnalis]|nr:hypothetical protein WT07_25025 [Burkholderia stagnalis]KVN66442.1 hypothetical protein WT14_09455 [Burkholderia stagnalis]KVO49471.1 hypothetical protein WT17_02485 [Burkholderia stagnalis]KVO72106.1 hypothetical protein WT19_17535 [Burkholderia stagnalis]KVW62641.1 hypothetical protein WT28_15185 [Burkholderia stagnalis]
MAFYMLLHKVMGAKSCFLCLRGVDLCMPKRICGERVVELCLTASLLGLRSVHVCLLLRDLRLRMVEVYLRLLDAQVEVVVADPYSARDYSSKRDERRHKYRDDEFKIPVLPFQLPRFPHSSESTFDRLTSFDAFNTKWWRYWAGCERAAEVPRKVEFVELRACQRLVQLI